jgi:hypothetical protein
MIGISGIARAGKDSLAKELKNLIEKDYDVEVKIIHLADRLKSDLDKLISCNFNFDVFTENNDEKELMRPILVAYGEAMKQKWGKEVWLKKLENEMVKWDKLRKEEKLKKNFYIIADVRFDFEVDYLFEKFKAESIHISKVDNPYRNEIEKLNDPLVKEKCNITHTWPPYEPDEMHLCNGHADILWQMIPEERKNKWFLKKN